MYKRGSFFIAVAILLKTIVYILLLASIKDYEKILACVSLNEQGNFKYFREARQQWSSPNIVMTTAASVS